MSVLRTIESKIEGLFEGVFGRAFRTHVQPVELARKLAKEMDEHRSVSVSRVYVPNEYTIYLSSADRQQFASYEGSLVGELQEYLTEHARREAYALLTPPRVRFAIDDDLAVGEFGIATRVAQPEDGVPLAPRSGGADAGAEASRSPPCRRRSRPGRARPGAPEPAPVGDDDLPGAAPRSRRSIRPRPRPRRQPEELVTLTLEGRAHPITSPQRRDRPLPRVRLRVADGNASRRHAEIVREGTTYVVVDLGSTNGTELNGRRITREELADGDRITIGATDLVFGRSLP